ncbi:YiaA/YiaB family inner membrane protein [Actinomadura macrotermitis]|uniref:YiaAB two helix domain-containing protein n=1 Tax=Actinomadura macrotermitis TaxID=2585200 RepID=A0A7K0BTK2_9ACTN|nr:YiaA/YiaB family inner membrane protein [Actinomadura macrotermitis]MQY04518.1 hypothetical protein [Actinomadura macrotermitis]
MNALTQLRGTTAFFVQAIISFVISFGAIAAGIALLPAPVWIRAFLALGMLYVTTSTFTLAKCVRDRQEAALRPGPGGPAGAPLPPGAPFTEAAGGSWS